MSARAYQDFLYMFMELDWQRKALSDNALLAKAAERHRSFSKYEKVVPSSSSRVFIHIGYELKTVYMHLNTVQKTDFDHVSCCKKSRKIVV